MAQPFEIGQNATKPLFVVVLKDDFGEAAEAVVDLTTAGTVQFSMRDKATKTVKVSRAGAAITNAAGGEVTYSWGTADTNTAGDYEAQVRVTWNDGKVEHFPSGPRGTDDGTGYWPVTIWDDI